MRLKFYAKELFLEVTELLLQGEGDAEDDGDDGSVEGKASNTYIPRSSTSSSEKELTGVPLSQVLERCHSQSILTTATVTSIPRLVFATWAGQGSIHRGYQALEWNASSAQTRHSA